MKKARAALAAEREKHAKALLAKQTRIEIFQQQLADQKLDLWDKISCARIEADNWKGLYEKSQKQLAAERKQTKKEGIAGRRIFERLVDALKKISGNNCKYCDCQEDSKRIADEALNERSDSTAK